MRDCLARLSGLREGEPEVVVRIGVVRIETNGRFDPHVHEALVSLPSEHEEGTIVEVHQKGYRLGEQVLRPARVAVAAPREE